MDNRLSKGERVYLSLLFLVSAIMVIPSGKDQVLGYSVGLIGVMVLFILPFALSIQGSLARLVWIIWVGLYSGCSLVWLLVHPDRHRTLVALAYLAGEAWLLVGWFTRDRSDRIKPRWPNRRMRGIID